MYFYLRGKAYLEIKLIKFLKYCAFLFNHINVNYLDAIASNIPIFYQKLDSFNEIIENTKPKQLCIEFDFAKKT